jgi:hypothetical protein
MRSNENKMSDGGQRRASLAVNVWKSSQKWSAQRSAVRSIAWLDGWSLLTGFLWSCRLNRNSGIRGNGEVATRAELLRTFCST